MCVKVPPLSLERKKGGAAAVSRQNTYGEDPVFFGAEIRVFCEVGTRSKLLLL